jgi:hypothetical protein
MVLSGIRRSEVSPSDGVDTPGNMTDILMHFAQRLRGDEGFVIGRVAIVVLILAIIVVAALVALIVPN